MYKYNEQQEKAILHKEGPMMVLAGPGCGKTSVITGRIQKLIENKVSPESILVVTFTRAAAAEMRERFLEQCPQVGTQVMISTFHSIFFYILRTECGLNSDSIIGEEFKTELIKKIAADNAGDSFWENEMAINIAREISYIKGNGISSENFYSSVLPSDTFKNIYLEYRRWLAENRRLDFDDINTALYQLFKSKPEVLKRWQNKFKYIMIDEFQDINRLQYITVRMIAEPQKNIFIVGDDDQSIYRFRGSDPSIMLKFPEDYKNCKTVSLTKNYRSTPQIISSASEVIKDNKKRFDKKLITDNADGAEIELRIFENIWKEMDELALEIRRSASNGAKYEDMAVLVRTNFGARPVIEKFISDRIPFYAQQDIPCIFDHFIAKDIIAYLSIAMGSRQRQDFLRIINRPNRYITKNALYESSISFENLYIYYEDRQWMWQRIEDMERDIRSLKDMPLYGAVNYIRKVIGYDEYLREYSAEKNIPPEEMSRIADEITESAKNFRELNSWLEHIARYSEEVKNRKQHRDEKNSVIISTLHGSKGKEYDIVFIIDVNEGVIPYRKAVLEADIEEERRLFYVGMTRARKQLKLFASENRFEKKTEISPFVKRLMRG